MSVAFYTLFRLQILKFVDLVPSIFRINGLEVLDRISDIFASVYFDHYN